MDALLLTLDIFAVILFGGWGAKYMDQRRRDKRYRPTYVLTLPSKGVGAEQCDDFFRTVHGLVSTAYPLGSAPTMSYQLWATGGMKTPRIKLPANLEEDLISQLHSAIPGMRVDKEKYPPRRVWTKVQEFAMRNKHRGLEPEDPAAASRRLTAAFNAVGDTETLLLDWVVTGAGRRELPQPKETDRSKFSIVGAIYGNKANPDEIKDRRGKESEPNLKATLRIAAVADTRERADQLVRRVRNALAPSATAYTHFRPRRVLSSAMLQNRVDTAAGSTSWPVRLTVSEFVRLCGWQIDAAPGVGFAPGRGMDLPPTQAIPTDGIELGTSTYPGQQRTVAIAWKEALRHILLLGKTGVGKSEAMATIARQIMDAGHGLILLEIAGDLFNKVLDYVPESRFEDVIVVNMADHLYPIPFNTLDQGNRSAAVDDLYQLLEYKMGGDRTMGPWASEVLYHSLQTIAQTPGLSFFDLLALIDPQTDDEKAWSDNVINGVTDPELKRWWDSQQRGKPRSEWPKKVAPVRSRMWQFISRQELRNTMGQSKSAFTWKEVLLENKILLISFKGVPEDAVGLACAMYMQSLWKTIKSTKKDTLSFLMVDEASEFMSHKLDFQKVLEQARKHKVGVIAGAQQLDQFQPVSLQKSVVQNMSSRIVFDTFAEDAAAMRREMSIDPSSFMNQPVYEAIAQLKTASGTAPPVTIRTLAPRMDRIKGSVADALIAQSQKLYGTPAEELQNQVATRRSAPPRSSGYKKAPPPDNEFGI